MQIVTITEYLKDHTQAETAKVFGVTPGAIQRMVRDGREVYIAVDHNGVVIDFYEIRRRHQFRSAAA